jgi:hypothetical protein
MLPMHLADSEVQSLNSQDQAEAAAEDRGIAVGCTTWG